MEQEPPIEETKVEEPPKEETKIEEPPKEEPPKEEEKKEEPPKEEEKKEEPPKLEENNAEVQALLIEKANRMKKYYNFSISYSEEILKIIKLLNDLLIERVNNTITENKNILKLFNDLSTFYLYFSSQIQKSNSIFTIKTEPKIYEDGLKAMLETTQNLLCTNFKDLSTSLKEKILSKTPIEKVDTLGLDIEASRKEILVKIDKIERRQKKLNRLYTTKFELLFNQIVPPDSKPDEQKKTADVKLILEDMPDFVLVEFEFLNAINKMFNKTNLFLAEVKDLAYKINHDVTEYSKVMKEGLMIYTEENKKIFNNSITSNFDAVEKYYEEIGKPGADHNFKMSYIFNTKELQDKMNGLLKEYQKLLIDTKIVTEDALNYNNRFEVTFYENVEGFLDLLISINPKPTQLSYDNLVLGTYNVRRDPGFFSSWKECVIIFSKQKHIIVCDEKLNKEYALIFEMGKIEYKAITDKKLPHQFEIIAKQKGKLMNYTGSYVFDAKDADILKQISEKF